MIIVNGVFSGLSLISRRKIGEFQKYILTQERNSKLKWLEAKKLIQSIAEEINKMLGMKLPTNLNAIAHHLNIDIEFESRTASGNIGHLYPISGGFKLIVFGQINNSKMAHNTLPLFTLSSQKHSQLHPEAILSHRERFTLAHELGHVFFYTSESSEKKPERLTIQKHVLSREKWREEGLCHDFARALLMPKEYNYMAPEPATAQGLLKITKAFNVSIEAAVRRILYDWEKWKSSLIVYADFNESILKVQCFRGVDRKKSGANNPTSTQISRLLKNISNPINATNILRQKYLIADYNMVINKRLFWAFL